VHVTTTQHALFLAPPAVTAAVPAKNLHGFLLKTGNHLRNFNACIADWHRSGGDCTAHG